MRIRVLGAYLPRLDPARMAKFIADDAESFRREMHDMRERGITKASYEEIEARAQELPAEVEEGLASCALFEAEVIGNNAPFDPAYFESPDTGQCGWEPAFLSLDGETVLLERSTAPADLKDFRVTFFLHDWEPNNRLVGPTGELQLPTFAPVPERLWKLAPYRPVD